MGTELVKVSSEELKKAATEAVTVLRKIQGDEDVSPSVRVSAAKAIISTALEVQREAERSQTANELDISDLDQLIANQRSKLAETEQ